MDCCAEWVPELRFHVVATFPVQSPTKKNTHTPHPMPPQSSLLGVLIKYMIFFCFHLNNLLENKHCCTKYWDKHRLSLFHSWERLLYSLNASAIHEQSAIKIGFPVSPGKSADSGLQQYKLEHRRIHKFTWKRPSVKHVFKTIAIF